MSAAHVPLQKKTLLQPKPGLSGGMLFFAILFFVLGAWLVIISGKLSGKAIELESLLEDAGITRVLRYIFTHNPFTGYEKDKRILFYGLAGILLMLLGIATAAYFLLVASDNSSR
jgi:hypothetical protein